MSTVTPEASENGVAYPRAWVFDEDGDLTGRFVRFDQGPTRGYGHCPICIVEVDGEERSLWLLSTALKGSFKEEVQRRPTRNLTAGERIVAVDRGTKTSESTGNLYRDQRALFPDRPAMSAAEVLGLDEPAPAVPEAEAVEDANDDVPF